MKKQKHTKNSAIMPPIIIIAPSRDKILSLLGITKKSNCFLWGRASDPELTPKVCLKFDAPSTVEIHWLLSSCAGIVKVSDILDPSLEGPENYIPVEEMNDVEEFEEFEEFEESSTDLNSALISFKMTHCTKNSQCQKMHYFVGVGTHVVNEKSYKGVHIFEAYHKIEGISNPASVSQQILSLRRVLNNIIIK